MFLKIEAFISLKLLLRLLQLGLSVIFSHKHLPFSAAYLARLLVFISGMIAEEGYEVAYKK